ncbi:MAG: membrane-bound lytic murein transglycosylase MltF, partial [Magnetococcales bacterium]|nr:membrane-bound lytic murein transglycosylase MltF [Magnetococcales bacterium]
QRNEGDLVAAGIAITPELEKQFLFGPVYQEVDHQVVCRRGGRRPNNLLQLAQVGVTIQDGTGVEERLRELVGIVPNLTWTVDGERSAEQILEQVWRKEVECAIADSNIVAINRRYFPELVVKFTLGSPHSLAWMLPKQARLLEREVDAWFRVMRANGQLEKIRERYYSFVEQDHMEYDYVDNQLFLQRIKERLGAYREWFRTASRKYGAPWMLLAAQAYQESHWDPEAVSMTGVKGLMMLTRMTAHDVGIRNRRNPLESIMGGAWYLADLLRRLPETIQEPDRTWIALAAYNVGMGHILDARELARRMDLDPDSWKDLQQALPLLSMERYYKTLRYGYARGSEPVRYVQRIRHYHDILQKLERPAPDL